MRSLIQFAPFPFVALAVLLAPTVAADEDEAATESATADDPSIEILEVQAHPLSGEGLSQAAIALDGEDLEREVAGNIGETVARQPGVHSAGFGEAVGRPVIHGMSGARVRIMEDRIDTMDASVTSADHATAVDPFIADRVEILKGSSTLLYGPGAIGGVVDVHTGRIPHGPRESITGKLEVRGADNGDRRNAAFRLDGGGESVAWHLDGFTRSANEYDIPGFAESARFHAAEEHEEEHDHEGEGHDEDEEEHHDEEEEHHDEEEEAYGTLPGSQVDGRGGAFGISVVGDWGFAGVTVSTLRYDYGLPGGHGHHGEEEHHDEEHHDEEGHDEDDHDEEAHEHEEEHNGHADEEGNVTLELDQTRVDFEAGIAEPFAGISSLNIRIGMNDYEHVEIEPSGEIGTLFENNAYEARIELANQDHAGLDGAVGVQFGNREFSAVGHEAFVPPVDTGSFGVFWVGERSLAGFDLETGVRLDRVSHDPTASSSTDFTTFSASLGVVIPREDIVVGLHADFSSRAPIAEELYSHGPHPATQSFEIGDPDLDAETALNAAATVNFATGRVEWTATAYATTFRDHIYQFVTGEVEDGFLVAQYGQADATYRGLDVSAGLRLATFDGGDLSGRFLFDTVAAELDIAGNDRLPRLPASRVGFGLDLERGRLSASVDFLRVLEQDEPAAMELATDAYDDVRVFLALDLGSNARLFFQGRNLTDDEQRQHTSYIKEFAPQPGRTLEAGFRLAF